MNTHEKNGDKHQNIYCMVFDDSRLKNLREMIPCINVQSVSASTKGPKIQQNYKTDQRESLYISNALLGLAREFDYSVRNGKLGGKDWGELTMMFFQLIHLPKPTSSY
jgi:hypothetical protein